MDEIKHKLKEQYSHIYSVSDDSGTEYLFRGLTVKEIKLVEFFITKHLKSSFEIEEYCFETCLLHPRDEMDYVSPGIVHNISEEVLIVSGITSAEYISFSMSQARERLSSDIILDIKSYILSAMPRYTDDELDKYTLLELIEKLILAEKILKLQAALAGMEADIELSFKLQGEEEPPAEVAPKAPSKQKTNKPTKEELLRRIQAENLEAASGPTSTYNNKDALEEFQGFDLDLLQKMEGKFDPNDPIARKLHGLN